LGPLAQSAVVPLNTNLPTLNVIKENFLDQVESTRVSHVYVQIFITVTKHLQTIIGSQYICKGYGCGKLFYFLLLNHQFTGPEEKENFVHRHD
jgi:hypothetical protein